MFKFTLVTKSGVEMQRNYKGKDDVVWRLRNVMKVLFKSNQRMLVIKQ